MVVSCALPRFHRARWIISYLGVCVCVCESSISSRVCHKSAQYRKRSMSNQSELTHRSYQGLSTGFCPGVLWWYMNTDPSCASHERTQFINAYSAVALICHFNTAIIIIIIVNSASYLLRNGTQCYSLKQIRS